MNTPLKKNDLAGLLAAALILFTVVSCGGGPPLPGPDSPIWVDLDRKDIPKPQYEEPSLIWSQIERSFFDQLYEGLDIERTFKSITGNRDEALNINSYDEVPNSSWFTNRIGLFGATRDDIVNGPLIVGGPDTTGPLELFRPKVGGATAGFWVTDRNGNEFIVKFDPKGYPGMATASSAMASRYFHTCGYNVPEETIFYFHPDSLTIKDGLTYKDRNGNRHPFTRELLDDLMSKTEAMPGGRVRAVASLALPNVLGPFSFDGRREDDPNDWCPHQYRRELRGLYVIASLINHYDVKDHNTMDSYWEGADGNSYVKHFLLDFASCFGSDGQYPKSPIKGYANVHDLRDAMVSILTLGLKRWPWEKAEPIKYREIGYFESESFEPNKFDPIVTNPAFENKTDRDAYWAAKIVMAWTDERLRDLISTAEYNDPEVEENLFRTVRERRDKIGRYWFSRVNPLDYFRVEEDIDHGLRIDFEDLWVKYGLGEQAGVKYRWMVHADGDELLPGGELTTTTLTLSPAQLDTLRLGPANNPNTTDSYSGHLIELLLWTDRGSGWSKPTRLWWWHFADTDRFKLVGIEHLD